MQTVYFYNVCACVCVCVHICVCVRVGVCVCVWVFNAEMLLSLFNYCIGLIKKKKM